MTERPGTWQRVRTNSGYHLRLIGANGEPVLTSEVYTDPRTVENAIHLAIRTALDNVETDHIVTVTAADDRGRRRTRHRPRHYGLRLDQIRTVIQD